jgi:hypothetical protein
VALPRKLFNVLGFVSRPIGQTLASGAFHNLIGALEIFDTK